MDAVHTAPATVGSVWTVESIGRGPATPRILLIVHSDDRTDDRVLELDPEMAIDLAVDLLNAATGRDYD